MKKTGSRNYLKVGEIRNGMNDIPKELCKNVKIVLLFCFVKVLRKPCPDLVLML